jgi:hypothetical protein
MTVFLALMIASHPATAVFYLPVFCLFALFVTLQWRGGVRLAVGVALAVTSAVVLTAPYWATTMRMKSYVYFDRLIEGYNQAQSHTVGFDQLFSRLWGFGSSIPDSPLDGMSFQLGLPLCLLALAGLWFGRDNRTVRLSFVIYFLLVACMTSLATPLWKIPSPFQYAQFPWRLLSVIAVFQALCIVGLAGLRRQPRLGRRYPVILAILWLILFAWSARQLRPGGEFDPRLTAEGRIQRMAGFRTFANSNEFLPRTADPPPAVPRDPARMIIAPRGVTVEPLPDNNPHFIHYTINSPAGSTEVFIQQLYFPGWHVELDGIPIADVVLRNTRVSDGRMRFWLDGAGPHELIAHYGGPPGQSGLFAVSLAWLALGVGGLALFGRHLTVRSGAAPGDVQQIRSLPINPSRISS